MGGGRRIVSLCRIRDICGEGMMVMNYEGFGSVCGFHGVGIWEFGIEKGEWEFSIVQVKSNACETSYMRSNAELLRYIFQAGTLRITIKSILADLPCEFWNDCVCIMLI